MQVGYYPQNFLHPSSAILHAFYERGMAIYACPLANRVHQRERQQLVVIGPLHGTIAGMAKLAPTLYELSVPTFLQTARAVGGFLDRATNHCAETGADKEELVKARLFPDMAPFHFQIEALKNHAVWGIEAVKTGAFAPPPLVGAMPFAELRAMVGDAITALEAFTPDEVNSWSGKNLNIEIYQPLDEDNATTSSWGPRTMAMTPETFLLSYSLPNFYFHVVTAYNILRTRGVPLGKYHYQGQLRTRPV